CATEALARRPLGDRGIDPPQVSLTGPAAPFDDAVGHFANAGVELGRHANRASLIRQAGRHPFLAERHARKRPKPIRTAETTAAGYGFSVKSRRVRGPLQ